VSGAIDEDVREALSTVFDPCSVAAGAPLSLIDMGLVHGWSFENGHLQLRLDITSPACAMAGHFIAEAEQHLRVLGGVTSVGISVQPSGTWTPDRITPEGRRLLDNRITRTSAIPVSIGGLTGS
jgi:metal-sulfur cluster biosynthetic enzyme